ncbi:MAG: hypothetical protein K6G80_04960 [Treponema sp.]|nr:hypothetical protein [Treponema sp.]
MGIIGRKVFKDLAHRYYQLYLSPAEGKSSTEEYIRVVTEGGLPDGFSSAPDQFPAGFAGSDGDRLFTVQTPVGAVECVYIENRADFERFIQIIVHRCEPVLVPKSMGACSVRGLVNWRKIEADRLTFMLSGADSFKDSLIIISRGAYSALPAESAGFSAADWLEKSFRIRLYHECTHMVCRERFEGRIYPVWDELLADCVGLLSAFGSYDRALALLFLGIKDGSYIGGRLENYIEDKQNIDSYVSDVLEKTAYLADMVDRYGKPDADGKAYTDEALFALCIKIEEDYLMGVN